jgi:hypothetical protein
LGELTFVNQAGVPTAPTNTHAIVASYTYASNVSAFDTVLPGSVTLEDHWDTFLYRFGTRKTVITKDRLAMCNMSLMSEAIMNQVEQAKSFAANFRREGTSLQAGGMLGSIKGVQAYDTTAPSLWMLDNRVVLGEMGTTRFRMLKPWSLSEMQDARDGNGKFTGQKEAWGSQYIVVDTPLPLIKNYTSIVLYSSTARVDR